MRFEKLENILTISKGRKPILTNEPNSGSIRFLQIDDLRNDNNLKYTNEKSGVIATKEDLLLAWDGANAGTVGYGKEGFIGSTIAVLRKKDPARFSTAFLGKFLQSQFNYLRDNATGATIPHIDRKSLEELRIPIIEIGQQIQIANILTKAESLINQRKESLHLLDEFLKSTFLEMFGDPIKNEKRFEVKAIEEVCENIFLGLTSKVEYVDQGGFPLIRATDIADGKLSFNKVKYISEKQHRLITKNRISKRGDLLISKSGSLGTCALVDTDLPFTTYESIITVQAAPTLLNNRYLMFLIRNSNFQMKMLGGKVGGTVGHLNLQMFRNIQLPVPSIELQEKFAVIVERTESIRTHYQNSLAELENLYASLSQKAFKGELQSKSAAKVISLQTDEKEEDYFKKRKALACYIINQSLDDDKFGDTKFEKLLNLSDQYAIQRNLGQTYYQKVAGPYDNEFTKLFYIQIAAEKLYKRKRRGKQSVFIPDINHKKTFTAGNYFSTDELARVDKLITYFKKCTYEEPEIISTLYAVWNNRIIRQQQITDEALKQDFLDWDENKKKYKDRLNAALAWMRKENIIANGWSKLIEKPKGKQRKLVVGKKRSSPKRAS